MDDFPAKLAAFLETTAIKVRSLTVDKAAKAVRLTTLGLIALTLGLMAVIFLFLTIYGSLEIPLGEWGAFAVLAGLFAVGGVFMWVKRSKD